jgi:hypothetical protein
MDIVERLRDCALQKFTQNGEEFHLRFCNDAANEIERLREALSDIASMVNPYEDADTMQEIARVALKQEIAQVAIEEDERWI